jgi:GNAT superfamily N-acetyltransferase
VALLERLQCGRFDNRLGHEDQGCELPARGRVAPGRSVVDYVPLELSSVLFLDLTHMPAPPALSSDLAIRVASAAEREAYAAAVAEGWGMDLGSVMFSAKEYVGFIVEKAGRTIATGGLIIHDRVALLAGASTIPDARGQGAQRAVLAARLKYAADLGCDLAMMVTEPGGESQRNAERNGFRIAYTRTKWRLAHL